MNSEKRQSNRKYGENGLRAQRRVKVLKIWMDKDKGKGIGFVAGSYGFI